jgi:hypothetical protein
MLLSHRHDLPTAMPASRFACQALPTNECCLSLSDLISA